MTKNKFRQCDALADILNLADIEVEHVISSVSSREVVIRVKSIKPKLPCKKCGRDTARHGSGRLLRLRHLSTLGKHTYIEIIPRRGICHHCDDKPTTTERMDWYDENSSFTKPYEQHLLFELANSTVVDIGIKECVGEHAVQRVVDRYIETDINFDMIFALGVLGIDEISLRKGYREFVTLMTYRIDDKVHILGIIKGREKADIEDFLRKIPKRLRRTIRAICCDLYKGYIHACKEVFKNKIPVVADRFHVRRLYRKNLVQLRKQELKRLKKQLTPQAYKALQPAIALLRKQKDYFSDEEKKIVGNLFRYSPKLKQAYKFSRQLTGVFDSQISLKEAKGKLEQWVTDVTASELTCFDGFMETLSQHIEEIVNYFLHRDSSGFVEGFNNKVKVIKRRCYGLKKIKTLFQRIILDTLGMKRYAPDMCVI